MIITLILKRLAAWRRYRANLRELGQLTDRELEDIGLSRGNVDYRRSHGRRVLNRVSLDISKALTPASGGRLALWGRARDFGAHVLSRARPHHRCRPRRARRPPGKSPGAASRSCCTKCARLSVDAGA